MSAFHLLLYIQEFKGELENAHENFYLNNILEEGASAKA